MYKNTINASNKIDDSITTTIDTSNNTDDFKKVDTSNNLDTPKKTDSANTIDIPNKSDDIIFSAIKVFKARLTSGILPSFSITFSLICFDKSS